VLCREHGFTLESKEGTLLVWKKDKAKRKKRTILIEESQPYRLTMPVRNERGDWKEDYEVMAPPKYWPVAPVLGGSPMGFMVASDYVPVQVKSRCGNELLKIGISPWVATGYPDCAILQMLKIGLDFVLIATILFFCYKLEIDTPTQFKSRTSTRKWRVNGWRIKEGVIKPKKWSLF